MRTGLAIPGFLLVVGILGTAAVSDVQSMPDSKPLSLKASNPQRSPVSSSQPSRASSAQSSTVSQPALTTFTVTISSDNDPGGFGEVGDLRFALNSMNQDLNTIPDDYAIVFASPMTIQLNGILPVINNSSNPVNITIGNPGSIPTVTIDGNSGAYPGFFVAMGNVTIQNMIFQNLAARGGNGGNGISGGGGGMGAGGAICAPQTFLNGSNPSITLINVAINNCSAIGGNGGSYFGLSSTGNEGGGGGGGFWGNGGSITTTGSTGGGGGGGFGGDGGDVTLSFDFLGGGGGGGGGLGSRATIGSLTNLGNGGSDQNFGLDGNGYGLTITAGSGGGGNSGGNNAGGGGGGGDLAFILSGGGGGGSAGANGLQGQGSLPPVPNAAPLGGSAVPSGGSGGDGGGGGGGGIVTTSFTNGVDGRAAGGGYGGGGGGGAGTGAFDVAYTVQGGSGGVGGGGGGGGVNQSGITSAEGGNSLGGGGGAGGGPSNGPTASGGTDIGNLGGGSGGAGANTYGSGSGGGGGGGGSGLGGAIFMDSGLSLIVKAMPGVPTIFNTSNNTTQPGTHGTGGPGGADGTDGSPLGDSIFLRTGSSITFLAQDTNDLLTLGDQVGFTDDTVFGAGGTRVLVTGNGTVVYNGTTGYQGAIQVNNANFKVNGAIDAASVFVCRNLSLSPQRGILSGIGTLGGDVYVNSGTIFPDAGATLTLGSLSLNPADVATNTLGSLVHVAINSSGAPSVVAITRHALLAGALQIDLDANAPLGTYRILTSSGITGAFDTVTFTGATPHYRLSYLPAGAPTYVQFELLAPTPTPTPTPAATPGQLFNISSRAKVSAGDQVSINGFIIKGRAPKKILVRASGPSLNVNGERIPGTLSDPVLDLHGSTGSLIFSNDNWTSSPQRAQIQASGLAPNDSREPAIIATLPQGSYTTVIRGKDNATGIALAEVYVLPPNNSSELTNVSGRAVTLTGDNVLISGLIVGGQTTKQIVVRAIGPTLHAQGITGELLDPMLDLYDANGAILRSNNDWGSAPNHAQIQSDGLAPNDERESAILLTLSPGAYTAIVRGVNGTTGVALIEVYALP